MTGKRILMLMTIVFSLFGAVRVMADEVPGEPVDFEWADIRFYSADGTMAVSVGGKNNSDLVLAEADGSEKQLFRAIRVDEEKNIYKIKSVYTGQCFDLTGGKSGDGVRVGLHNDNGTDSQKWQIFKNDGRYFFKRFNDNRVVTITENGATAGTYSEENAPVYRYDVMANGVLGDVSGNEAADTADARLILKYISGLAGLNDVQIARADFNSDTKVDLRDVIAILGAFE
ncbi:MAG: RICIN domain-containing protein [Firmicutes bacterium]|nr:RICIN domain-containing protein [Bacillota bacterium]